MSKRPNYGRRQPKEKAGPAAKSKAGAKAAPVEKIVFVKIEDATLWSSKQPSRDPFPSDWPKTAAAKAAWDANDEVNGLAAATVSFLSEDQKFMQDVEKLRAEAEGRKYTAPAGEPEKVEVKFADEPKADAPHWLERPCAKWTPAQKRAYKILCDFADSLKEAGITIADVFRVLDDDGSGELGYQELLQGMRHFKSDAIGDAGMKSVMYAVDEDMGGTVTLEEFEVCLARLEFARYHYKEPEDPRKVRAKDKKKDEEESKGKGKDKGKGKGHIKGMLGGPKAAAKGKAKAKG